MMDPPPPQKPVPAAPGPRDTRPSLLRGAGCEGAFDFPFAPLPLPGPGVPAPGPGVSWARIAAAQSRLHASAVPLKRVRKRILVDAFAGTRSEFLAGGGESYRARVAMERAVLGGGSFDGDYIA